MEKRLEKELAEISADGLFRSLSQTPGIDFSSNDHPGQSRIPDSKKLLPIRLNDPARARLGFCLIGFGRILDRRRCGRRFDAVKQRQVDG